MFFSNEPIIIAIDNVVIKPLAVVEVGVRISDDNGEYYFKQEACEHFLSFDISSAFSAAFIRQGEISPTSTSYQPLSAEWYAKESYFVDGEITSRTLSTGVVEDVHRGGRSEVMRYLNISAPSDHLTNKPKMEVIGIEDKYILPSVNDSIIQDASQIKSSLSLYIEKNTTRMCFAFINSYGLLESASAIALEDKTYKIKTTEYNRVGEVSLRPQPHYEAIKSNGYAEWTVASGYNTREWIEWWATEFAMSPRHWLLRGGVWLPVSVSPEETMTVYEKSKGELKSISFTVKSLLQGKL